MGVVLVVGTKIRWRDREDVSRYATRGSHTSREANDTTSLLATSYGSIHVKYHEVVGVAAAWQVAAKWHVPARPHF